MSCSSLTCPIPSTAACLKNWATSCVTPSAGCSVTTTAGKYRSTAGAILPDKVNVLFSDTPFYWDKDRFLIERYAEGLRQVVQQVLSNEEAILIAVYPVYHVE